MMSYRTSPEQLTRERVRTSSKKRTPTFKWFLDLDILTESPLDNKQIIAICADIAKNALEVAGRGAICARHVL